MSVANTHITNNRIHPQKFAMWLAIGSIIMMFAGLTSAYLVNQSKGNWLFFPIPKAFWYSTFIIIISSLTISISKKELKKQNLKKYKLFLSITCILGLLFICTQIIGFKELFQEGIKLSGNPSESFFYIIPGMHAIHVLGGMVALIYLVLKSFFSKNNTYSLVPIDIVSTYWHFVDFLWIYLFLFFLVTQQFKL